MFEQKKATKKSLLYLFVFPAFVRKSCWTSQKEKQKNRANKQPK